MARDRKIYVVCCYQSFRILLLASVGKCSPQKMMRTSFDLSPSKEARTSQNFESEVKVEDPIRLAVAAKTFSPCHTEIDGTREARTTKRSKFIHTQLNEVAAYFWRSRFTLHKKHKFTFKFVAQENPQQKISRRECSKKKYYYAFSQNKLISNFEAWQNSFNFSIQLNFKLKNQRQQTSNALAAIWMQYPRSTNDSQK